MAAGTTRRALLAASAAAVPVVLTACRGIQVLGAPPPPPPDVRLLRSVIAAEQSLITRYRLALAQAGPAAAADPRGQVVTARLAVVLTEHEQHLALVRKRLIEPAGYLPSPAASAARIRAAGLDEMLAALAAEEQAASDRLAAGLLTMPPSVAQLLASISASEATHVPVLHALRQGR